MKLQIINLNPKSEFRNPKQFLNEENPNDQNKSFENLNIRKFEFVSTLRQVSLTQGRPEPVEGRISDFPPKADPPK